MRITILIIFFLTLTISGCLKKKEQIPKEPVIGNIVPFTAPTDSSISLEQMKKWLRCNPLLDSLSYVYLDSFKTEDPQLRQQYQSNFITAQDTICIQQGLSGGYEEYLWIMKNAGSNKNRAVLSALNIKTF